MILETENISDLSSIVEKNTAFLGEILYHKYQNIKQDFNYRGKPFYFDIVVFKDYGVHFFPIYYHTEDELESDYDFVIGSFQQFEKKIDWMCSQSPILKANTPNIHPRFPKVSKDYFSDKLFDVGNKELMEALREELKSPIGHVTSSYMLKEILSYKGKPIVGENIVQTVKRLFTNDTCRDTSGLVLDDKKDQRIDSMLKRFELDDSQIKIIEQYNSENRIMLAEAGTGKSVILFSKAQRIAALNPGKKILMLAYNSFLVEEMRHKREYENLKAGDFTIKTIDSFLANLYNELIHEQKTHEDFDKDFYIKELNQVSEKLPNYDAIYIDEVQQFEVDWINFIFNRLTSHEEGKYSFILCGDINQTSNKKQNKKSWRAANLPSFQGRSIKLKKKYRSSESINHFVDELVKNIYTFVTRYKLPLINELENEETYSIEIREDFKLKNLTEESFEDVSFFKTTTENRAREIVDYLKKLQNEGIDLREVMILYPVQRSYNVDYVLNLENELRANDITFMSTRDTNGNPITYENVKENLSISTIDKCIGIDFKYIMVIGLEKINQYRRDKVDQTSIIDPINNQSDQDSYLSKYIAFKKYEHAIEYPEEFKTQLSKFYISMTRARRKMYIEISENLSRNMNLYKSFLLGDNNGKK